MASCKLFAFSNGSSVHGNLAKADSSSDKGSLGCHWLSVVCYDKDVHECPAMKLRCPVAQCYDHFCV